MNGGLQNPTPPKQDQPINYVRLTSLYGEIRSEIWQRIGQRDQYSIQMTISLAAIIAVAGASNDKAADLKLYRVILAAPLIAIYYTALIQYSYSVHRVLAELLRTKIEPELARIAGTQVGFELETFYATKKVPGIRKAFFFTMMWTITISSSVTLALRDGWETLDGQIICGVGLIYLFLCVFVTYVFRK